MVGVHAGDQDQWLKLLPTTKASQFHVANKQNSKSEMKLVFDDLASVIMYI